MQHASAPCLDRDDRPLFPLLRRVWQTMLTVSAVHVRIAFDRPWDRP